MTVMLEIALLDKHSIGELCRNLFNICLSIDTIREEFGKCELVTNGNIVLKTGFYMFVQQQKEAMGSTFH